MTFDIERQCAYWSEGARDDWESAGILIEKGKIRQGLFFAHLSLEKALKAHVVRATGTVAPKLHDLPRLAELGGVSLDEVQRGTLAVANAFNLAGRYPDAWPALPEKERVGDIMREIEEVWTWLQRRS